MAFNKRCGNLDKCVCSLLGKITECADDCQFVNDNKPDLAEYNAAVDRCDMYKEFKSCSQCKGKSCYADRYLPEY